MVRAKVYLRYCLGILIRALGKMEHGQFGSLFKQRHDKRYAIQLLRVTVIVQSQDQITSRLAHHAIARRYRTEGNLIHEQPRLWQLRFHGFNHVFCAAVDRDEHLQRRRIQLLQSMAGPPQILDAVPGSDHHGDTHGQDRSPTPQKSHSRRGTLVEE
jgi:hypothetical protein